MKNIKINKFGNKSDFKVDKLSDLKEMVNNDNSH